MHKSVCHLSPTSVVACLLLVPTYTTAQVERQSLTQADVTFPEPFTRIVGLRELSDGRVLIADQVERQVSLIDFESGAVDQLGRRGQGPGEYESPRGLLSLSGGASLLVDFGNMRMTRIEADGRLTTSWSLMSGGEAIRIIQPTASDLTDRVYYSGAAGLNFQRGGRGPEPSDSAPLLRWDPESNATDTVATLHAPPAIAMNRGGGVGSFRFNAAGGARITGIRRHPFQPRDAWTVAPDGRVAVVRATEYRVDWFSPDGRMTRGPVVDYRPIRVTNAEKQAWADQQAGQQMTMRVLGGTGGGSRTFQAPRPDVDAVDFPDFKPPFGENAAAATPDGNVWVKRSRRHDEETTLYDVFNADGERVRQVQLDENRQVVGFGTGVVYVVATDEYDLQWLERYKL